MEPQLRGGNSELRGCYEDSVRRCEQDKIAIITDGIVNIITINRLLITMTIEIPLLLSS